MTVADTDVLIDYLAGKGEADAVERLLSQGALRTTVITRFELLSGAKNAKQLARLMQLLDAVPSLALNDAATEILRSLDRSGNPIGMADSLIAGIVTTNHATLLTRNRRHFERVPGIRLA
jgi:predicted nucleic acid-binding protein